VFCLSTRLFLRALFFAYTLMLSFFCCICSLLSHSTGLLRYFRVKIVGNVSNVYKKVSLILFPAFYKVFFLFDLIFKKAIAVLGVYNLVDLLLIVFFIITAVISLNLYRRLRWLMWWLNKKGLIKETLVKYTLIANSKLEKRRRKN
jgi:hypothetical protein